MKLIADLLHDHPFFAGLSPAYINLLAGCGKNIHFDTGDFLMKEGEDAHTFYVIRSGKVVVEAYTPGFGHQIVTQVNHHGVVGYSWLFPPYRVAFDVRAIEPVSAVQLDGECLRSKTESDHELGYQLMQRFAQVMLQRLQATRLQMLDVYRKGS
ncbi:MAG: cyclic nucleotide-binding domain-containing protein [Nitrosomonas sp.]|jgi:CRP-like cAMP-binding protein|nr:cyclic nucleotide-binding domain-containing protein [Nitrosomonas sp.]